jgi:hypothetical protein
MGRAVPMSLASCGFPAGTSDVTRFWVDIQPI